MSNPGSQSQPSQITPDSSSVQSYLNILQGIITRMATNSANCKTWCISLVSAILVVIADKNKPNYALIALVPIVLFCLLDSYYLALERSFRKIYEKFIENLHKQNVQTNEIFVLKLPTEINSNLVWQSIKSFSVWPFYLVLLVTVIIARFVIL